MSALKAFLQPSISGKTKEVVISERFQDENGQPAPFVIKAISQKENEKLSQMSKIKEVIDGTPVEKLDNILYTKRLVHACVQEPDFSDQEICQYYGTVDPLDVPSQMLSIGEYSRLSEAILELNGLKDPRKKLEEAKNS
ncbi:phage tail assembly chaperone [Lacrimispora sp.]|uniref:phage tail assembly chaperone n=1 Tax=Lacrimispora sp. TaxID=2719234 RepID=UPI002FDAFA3C